jgi:hypothetical protein
MSDNLAIDFVQRAQLTESRRLERISLGLPPAPPKNKPDRDAYVQIVEDAGFMDFGFLCFRTVYGDEERWERWEKKFDEELEGGLVGYAGRERVAERTMVMFANDSATAGKILSELVAAFHEIRENGTIPPGLDVGMCLILDEEAMSSLLEPVEGQDAWVWAIDVHYDFDGTNTEEGGYPGRFKVANSALLGELWPMLISLGPESLWSFADPIWKGIIL